jgi:putative flavoprotein involved in K+ transport
MPWQHTRGSALLGWIKDDAEHMARHISAPAQHHSAAREP